MLAGTICRGALAIGKQAGSGCKGGVRRTTKRELKNSADARTKIKDAFSTEFVLGDGKDAGIAAIIALPCLSIFGLWNWAEWYEKDRMLKEGKINLDGLTESQRNHLLHPGWSGLLGIEPPKPSFSTKDMMLNFTVIDALFFSPECKEQGWKNMITHAFSHRTAAHLACNMIGLYLCTVNVPLSTRLGGPRFVGLFLASAIAGEAFQMCMNRVQFHRTGDSSCLVRAGLGASGGISGTMMAAFLWRPKAALMLPGFIMGGIPAWTCLAYSCGSDIFGLMGQLRGGGDNSVGHGAHIGGSSCGMLAFLFWRKTLLKV